MRLGVNRKLAFFSEMACISSVTGHWEHIKRLALL